MTGSPIYDAAGLHVLDPNDRRGFKSAYITLLQEKALRRHLPHGDGGVAVDLGCGYGRLTPILCEHGWRAIGIDPSLHLIEFARKHYPGPEYRLGGLPELPLPPQTVRLMLIQNVLRALMMMGKLSCLSGLGRYLAPGASVLLVENLRSGHRDYLPEADIVDIMAREGLRLAARIPIRAARWWMIYLIRYGLIPRSWFDRIATWELDRMRHRTGVPRWQYWNVLFIFQKLD